MRVLCIHGPNLDRLGTREPEVYGTTTLQELETRIGSWGRDLGIEIETLQSNHEGDIIEAVHRSEHDGIVINPGALTHTSRALGDAVGSVDLPVVEVHISNIREREPWRNLSVLSGVAVASIFGRGLTGYRDALRHLLNRLAFDFETVPYGPHPDNVGDLRRGGSGLVLLAHGGFWRQEWARDTMDSTAVELSRRGYNTFNLEYRRIGSGGGWPGSAQDVLTAVEFAPQLGVDHGGLTVIGHSAGGHMAIWVAGRARVEVRRVIALAPLTNLRAHAASGLDGAAEARRLLDDGAPPDLRAGGARITLVHGEDDRLVPPAQSTSFADREESELTTVPGGHFDLLDPSHEHWDHLMAAVEGG